MLENIKQAIPNAMFSYNQYKGSGAYFVLFFISLIVLYFFSKEIENKQLFKTYTIYYPLLAFVMIFNPLVAGPIIYVIKDYVYWRTFWIIPMSLIIALAMTVFVMKTRKRRDRIIAAVSCCVVIWVSGSFIVNSDNYQKPANWYKLPTAPIAICQMIREDTDGYAKVAVPVHLVSYIRQYDASIMMPYGRGQWGAHRDFMGSIAVDQPNFEQSKPYIYSQVINYIVVRSEQPDEIILPDWCEKIGIFEKYCLIKIEY